MYLILFLYNILVHVLVFAFIVDIQSLHRNVTALYILSICLCWDLYSLSLFKTKTCWIHIHNCGLQKRPSLHRTYLMRSHTTKQCLRVELIMHTCWSEQWSASWTDGELGVQLMDIVNTTGPNRIKDVVPVNRKAVYSSHWACMKREKRRRC